ncbi:Chromodomain helicase-DNA-binding protein [Reticulomyxa filosa]|uniref:Chromodomain helicase-DNA-binding protein n=1 Tax=Reticulomyxa filosa TaxID=46433 RepID=X6MRH4_RETFI|nr:Chromodomain helicase-DNA-binding protein [Reticulomyxa filosa]|eukprot:ETO16266.1 Chromodomain helicase-DNA-binding protein [Reticulomyxa filosa]
MKLLKTRFGNGWNVLTVIKDNTISKSALRFPFTTWEHRGRLILEEIVRQMPDIVCLQDVDQFDYFQQRLFPRGFVGIYERRRPTPNSTYYVSKGLATFWRTDKFELVGRGVYSIRSHPAESRQDHIALLARLKRREPYDSKRAMGEIDVWNSHLKSGANQIQHVRLGQVKTLFDVIGHESNVELTETFHGSREVSRDSLSASNSDKIKKDTSETDKATMSIEKLQQLFKQRMEKAIVVPNTNTTTTTTTTNTNININTGKSEEKKNEDTTANTEKGQEKGKDKEQDKEQDKEKEKGKDRETEKDKKKDPEKKKDDGYKTSRGGTSLQRPVILCIDFSDQAHFDPDKKIYPMVYAYLTNRSRTTEGNPEYNRLVPSELKQHHSKHSWFLQSAYALGFGREPPFTTCVNQQFTLSSDLILFTPQNFRVINLLEPLSREWVEHQETKSLPCRNYPSDHYLIGCDLELAIGHTANPTTGNEAYANVHNMNVSAMSGVPNRLPNQNFVTPTNPLMPPNQPMNFQMSAVPHFAGPRQPMINQPGLPGTGDVYKNGNVHGRMPNFNFPTTTTTTTTTSDVTTNS